jgi:hypothetical protein
MGLTEIEAHAKAIEMVFKFQTAALWGIEPAQPEKKNTGQ